jgi:hypothetical protein
VGGILQINDDDPNLLSANRNDDGRWLNAYYDDPGNRWNRENGFAFVVPQISSFLSHFYEGVLFLTHFGMSHIPKCVILTP